jgi:transglutaminase-like putative cysteine protease
MQALGLRGRSVDHPMWTARGDEHARRDPATGYHAPVALNSHSPQAYLGEDAVADFGRPEIGRLAGDLRSRHTDDVDFARAAFEHVRDNIRHSWDAQDTHVSITASDTLAHGTGLCFAKAHLLAAILRSQGIPTGFCYQRLTDDGATFMLHGLVAVFLNGQWHRQDARGNKPGVDAQFSLDEERLAWPVRPELGERDYDDVFTAPSPSVIETLQSTNNILDLCHGGLPSDL